MGSTGIRHRRLVASRKQAGFTLVELLVVTGILVIISSIMLANNAAFGGIITLRNLTYDIAISVREAQIYGISVRRFGTDEFEAGYGVHFRSSSPTSYILFADAGHNGSGADDGLYSGESEQVEVFTIGRNYQIDDLCVTTPGAAEMTCGLQKLDVVFIRPEPDAHIRYNDNSTLNQRARIDVRSPRGDVASIFIEATGQISVQ